MFRSVFVFLFFLLFTSSLFSFQLIQEEGEEGDLTHPGQYLLPPEFLSTNRLAPEERNSEKNERATDEFVMILEETANPDQISQEYGVEFVSCLENTKVCLFRQPQSDSANKNDEEHPVVSRMRRDVQIKSVERQTLRNYIKHTRDYEQNLTPSSWHLVNQYTGEDVNILGAWENYSGLGVTIGIVDDSLQHTHPDIQPNYRPDLSWDFNGVDSDPSPTKSSDNHGTSVAGVAAAASNTICGLGAAYQANISGLRLISSAISDWQIAQALTFSKDISIYSNSWGFDKYLTYPLSQTLSNALQTGVETGRGGKGAIYTWAVGNSRTENGNANYDSFANAPESIGVAAVSYVGTYSYYSNPGCAVFVSAPSSGGGVGIFTTDRTGSAGYASGDCTSTFGGTSSSTPLVSGCIALMLEANPNLGWRDVQHILAHTARKNDASNSDWKTNGAGFHVNHDYGFGVVDASAAVELAKSWTNVPARASIRRSAQISGSKPIPNTGESLILTLDVSEGLSVEHVQVLISLEHQSIKSLSIQLISPSGTVSRLLEPNAPTTVNQFSWKFMTVFNWGEISNGLWTLNITDTSPHDSGTGKLYLTELTIWGHDAKLDLQVQTSQYCTGQQPVTFTWDLPRAKILRVISAQGADYSYPVDDQTQYTIYGLPADSWVATLSDSDLIHGEAHFTLPTCAEGYIFAEVVSCGFVYLTWRSPENGYARIKIEEIETGQETFISYYAPKQGSLTIGRPFYGQWKAVIDNANLTSDTFSGGLCQTPLIQVDTSSQCDNGSLFISAQNALQGMIISLQHGLSDAQQTFPCTGANPMEFSIPRPEQDGIWSARIEYQGIVLNEAEFTVSTCREPVVSLANQTNEEICQQGVIVSWENAPEGSIVGLRSKSGLAALFEEPSELTHSSSGNASFSVSFDGDWSAFLESHDKDLLAQSDYISIKCQKGPSVPANFRVTDLSATRVSFSWGRPEDDGGSPVYRYTLGLSEDGQNWQDFEILWWTRARFSGFTPNNSYYARIRAGNIQAYGPWTQSLAFFTPPS